MTNEMTFNKVELTEVNQAESKKYLDKLEEIAEQKRSLEARNIENEKQILAIQKELEQLEFAEAKELDLEKAKAISLQRKALEEQRADIRLLEDYKIKEIIRERVQSEEVKALEAAADVEYSAYSQQAEEVLKQLEAEVTRLKSSRDNHLRRAGQLKKVSF